MAKEGKSQIWEMALGEMEISLSKANFTTWFSKTYIKEIKDGVVVVAVPNAFTKEWLSNKYHKIICEALRKSLPGLKKVTYEIGIAKETLYEEPIEKTGKKKKTKVDGVQKKEELGDSLLNPKYTFANFIVGPSNELARAASIAVSKKPGIIYNPLFIYGGVGLGKTHLMQAIGHETLRNDKNKKVKYVTSEKFTNEFIHAVEIGKTGSFKQRYRKVDVLLVDDIHFLAGKEQTQEEFFHTFNALHQADKQIVVTSDRPPKAIPQLELRLVSRFEWGMVADIGLPDFETRTAILQRKVNNKGYEISDEIIKFIAQNIQHNIREMEGALNRILAHIQLQHSEPDQKTMENILANIIKNPKRKRLSAKEIIGQVSAFYDLDQKDITGKCRKKEYVRPRQIAMYLMRKEINVSYPSIGDEFGKRDHTTAMHAVNKIEKEVEEEENTEQEINLLRERLYMP